jgi:hypothetical protein
MPIIITQWNAIIILYIYIYIYYFYEDIYAYENIIRLNNFYYGSQNMINH